MGRIFGTDGIRAKPYEFPLEKGILLSLGKAFSRLFDKVALLPAKRGRKRRVLFIRDTRGSGKEILKFLARGFIENNWDVEDLGVLPTGSLSYLVRFWKCDLGCVLSASHNPAEFNGVKFFGPNGCKIPDDWEKELENLILSDRSVKKKQISSSCSNSMESDAFDLYQDFLRSRIKAQVDFSRARIALDCANGAAYKIAPKVYSLLGIQTRDIAITPNGLNINLNSGSLAPQKLSKEVRAFNAHCGFAYDGDADRLAVVDEKGRAIPGEWVLATVALRRKARLRPGSDALVTTAFSNYALGKFLNKHGVDVVESEVGDSKVLAKLFEMGLGFGGESSGHYIWPGALPAADGILASLFMTEWMITDNKRLSQLIVSFPLFAQVKVNLKTPAQRPDIKTLKGFSSEVKKVKSHLGGNGRLVVRYSGTEPVLRILIEGDIEKKKLHAMAESLVAAYEKNAWH
ncbi:hypothetical protein ACFL6Y_02495 [Elusimicrobiota bacterium]